MSKAPAGKESGTPPGFNGLKELWAALIGAGIGVVLALFLETFIRIPASKEHITRFIFFRSSPTIS